MKESIKNIEKFSKQYKLSFAQTLFLFSIYCEIYTCDINADELLDLVSKGYMNGNKLANKAKELITVSLQPESEEQAATTQAINSSLPKLTRDTAQLTKRLAVHFLGNMLQGYEYSKMEEAVKDPIQIPFFFIFMQMFPSSDKSKNLHWNKHFNSEWDNVTLRRITTGTVRKFKEIYKSKDIGLFLLGTYLFITHAFNKSSGKYFIKNIENYLKEYKNWYQMAEESLEKGDFNHLLSGSTVKVKNESNTFVA